MMTVKMYKWIMQHRDMRQVALNHMATYASRVRGYYFSHWPRVNTPQQRHWRAGRKPKVLK